MNSESIISDSALAQFRQVTGMISDAHVRSEERSKATHERFNVFTTLLQAHDEVRLHTRFLHCLLDPNGSHDCGSLFLELFFTTLADIPDLQESEKQEGPIWPAADEKWRVQKETGRSEGYGQLDLLLDHPEGYGVGIENKIHAHEQGGQLASYAKYLRQEYKTNWKLIYLTLDGKKSETHDDHPYARISYEEHILSWLDLCLEKTYHIIPVNQVILQYRSLVRKLTGKTMETETLKKIARFIADNPDVGRYRKQISNAVDESQTAFMEELGKQVIHRLKGEYEIRMEPANGRFGSGNYEELVFRCSDGNALIREPFKVCLEYDVDGEVLVIGIFISYDKKQQILSEDQQRFVSEMSAFQASMNPTGNDPTPAWPLGWMDLLVELDDNGFANLIQRGIPSVLDELCAAIQKYLKVLSLACEKCK